MGSRMDCSLLELVLNQRPTERDAGRTASTSTRPANLRSILQEALRMVEEAEEDEWGRIGGPSGVLGASFESREGPDEFGLTEGSEDMGLYHGSSLRPSKGPSQ